LQLETQRAQVTGLRQALERMGGQRGQLDSRLGEISTQLAAGDTPVDALEQQRQAALAERVNAEQVLAQARSALDGIGAALRARERVRHQRDEQAIAQREAIAQRRLDQQALVIHAEQLGAAVVEAGFVLDEVVAGLADDASADAWGRMVADFDAKLRRLEPVNLAAIQEHAEAAQRKDYLDSQDADLNSALETLEDAIRKIDRETRGRFKDTFDRVNSGVQEIYPRLFGGGHAYLELTGEDLLDTGVAIMARPPGKRVSNISLLSGGEKAMTAVALVFAIFQLSPAPFCLLDEVDAPLDEANVGRFSAMVTEMSEKVQFLFVTHNKATMEAAKQLSGVTMREPGVSRLVSVDLAEAARLAGAASHHTRESTMSDAWLLRIGILVAGILLFAAIWYFGRGPRGTQGSCVPKAAPAAREERMEATLGAQVERELGEGDVAAAEEVVQAEMELLDGAVGGAAGATVSQYG